MLLLATLVVVQAKSSNIEVTTFYIDKTSMVMLVGSTMLGLHPALRGCVYVHYPLPLMHYFIKLCSLTGGGARSSLF